MNAYFLQYKASRVIYLNIDLSEIFLTNLEDVYIKFKEKFLK